MFLVLTLFLIAPIKESYSISQGVTPAVDDAWFVILENLKVNSDPSSIITSWWDYNHMFKAIADRRVTFDGGSQNTPQAYWVGKLFLSDDERVSIGIARMLNCGGNKAFDEVDKHLTNIPDSVALVNEIITVDRWHAENLLVERLSMSYDETESVLQYTHCEPPESYIIASGDMVGKSGVWGHFGSWDFYKAEEVFSTPKEQRIGKLADADSYAAGWPSYSGNQVECWGEEGLLACDLGGSELRLNLETKAVNSSVFPEQIVYENDSGVISVKLNSSSGFSLIIPGNQGVLSHPTQASSLFTKMYFFEGKGLDCFELFDKQTRINGERIYVYKADWSCS